LRAPGPMYLGSRKVLMLGTKPSLIAGKPNFASRVVTWQRQLRPAAEDVSVHHADDELVHCLQAPQGIVKWPSVHSHIDIAYR
jgi:hypothetical protein